ncbi:tryptophan synthase alpha chain [Mitsuaria sp. BK045]|uniref:tryptophan synthase subunit alpha n=1 Tax=unclassified Roseateles TaxID=2626991 RepID=UPI00160DB04C|nr:MULTISPECIES: tryptophan synthase subunit alpha [unclassified Roseateles]MBB3293024.1 tryptophan synthase alpha chain [Mitsuaria sp. BK041]MBB3362241.1 tryptophan synthase alpha chain [Mitsuaria sp. BK045]
MSRIQATFERLAAAGRKALIPYVTAGDPYADVTVELMLAMAQAGADVIELGVPFSDPMADGPVIQRASERALQKGITLTHVLEMVRAFRQQDADTPVVLMGYANPVERFGLERFVTEAQAAGVDGVLVVDYPPEECEAFATALKAKGLDPIFLLAPTSTDERVERLGRLASGYVYYVSLKGVTGAGHLDTGAVADAMPRLRRHVKVPLGVGFGIRDGATAAAVARHADAVVIGSALVQLIELQSRDNVAIQAAAFIRDIRAALDA